MVDSSHPRSASRPKSTRLRPERAGPAPGEASAPLPACAGSSLSAAEFDSDIIRSAGQYGPQPAVTLDWDPFQSTSRRRRPRPRRPGPSKSMQRGTRFFCRCLFSATSFLAHFHLSLTTKMARTKQTARKSTQGQV